MSKFIVARTENMQVSYPDTKTGEVSEAVIVMRKVICIEVMDGFSRSQIIEVREDLLDLEA